MPVKSRESASTCLKRLMVVAVVLGTAAVFGGGWLAKAGAPSTPTEASNATFDDQIRADAQSALVAGQKTFRFDTLAMRPSGAARCALSARSMARASDFHGE